MHAPCRTCVLWYTAALAASAVVAARAEGVQCGEPIVIRISTGAQLLHEVAAGAEHVELIDHLDLTALLADIGAGREVANVVPGGTRLRSITGDCKDAPSPYILPQNLAHHYLDGHCVLKAGLGLLDSAASEASASHLWLSGLLLYAASADPTAEVLSFSAFDALAGRVSLTDSTLLGQSSDIGLLVEQGTLFAQRIAFVGCAPAAVTVAGTAVVTFADSMFVNTTAAAGMAGAVTIKNNGRALLLDNAFNNTRGGADVYVEGSNASAFYVGAGFTTEAPQGAVAPWRSDGATFVQRDDADLLDIQQAVASGRRVLAQSTPYGTRMLAFGHCQNEDDWWRSRRVVAAAGTAAAIALLCTLLAACFCVYARWRQRIAAEEQKTGQASTDRTADAEDSSATRSLSLPAAWRSRRLPDANTRSATKGTGTLFILNTADSTAGSAAADTGPPLSWTAVANAGSVGATGTHIDLSTTLEPAPGTNVTLASTAAATSVKLAEASIAEARPTAGAAREGKVPCSDSLPSC